MKPTRYFFRVDGGNVYSLAMGHVTRCLKLARYLKKRPNRAIFFLMKDHPEAVRKVEDEFPVIRLPRDIFPGADANRVRERLEYGDAVITDVRNLPPDYLETLKGVPALVCSFDDLGETRLRPHVLVNPSPEARAVSYPENGDCTFLLGLDYFVLSEAADLPRKHAAPSEVRRLLLSFGGADPTDTAGKLLAALDARFHGYHFNVVLGCAYPAERETQLRKTVEDKNRRGFRIEIRRDRPSLFPDFMECDAAWVAGGDTCLESLYTGTPTFIVSTIDYEARTADRLEAVGAAVHVGSIESASPAALLDRIFTLQENPEKIEQLHKNALTVIDGRGIARIADAIENKHRALFSTKTPGVTAT